MKIAFILVTSTLACHLAHAQLMAPDHPPERSVGNADMVVQPGGHRLEIFPDSRAVGQGKGTHKLSAASSFEPISRTKPAVAYSYATGGNVMLSGEISFKLKGGASVATVGAFAAGAKLLVPPDVYMLTASTPADLVNVLNQLQGSSAVEWVEPFTIPGKLN